MTDAEVEKLLAGLGNHNPAIQEIARGEEESSWDISLGDDERRNMISVGVAHREDERKLVFFAGLPVPDRNKRAATHELLLEFNALWLETGGQRMALNENGVPILIVDVTLPGLEAEELAKRVEAFAARVLSWSILLDDGGVETDEADVGGDMEEYAFRV